MASDERVRTVTRRYRVVPKTCPVCGTVFEGLIYQKYDSKACAVKADYQRRADQYRTARRERYRRQRGAQG